MAYHREWDRGKDYDYDYDDHYKRRRYNGPDDSYHDDYTVAPTNEDRSRIPAASGHHQKKRLLPSEPSPHVIFLGLDPDFTEADLQAYLLSCHCNVETVTIIRERSSGASKGFGFAQFSSIELASAFVDPSFPFIQMPPPASHGASAKAAFYKALETGVPHNGRRVKIDYSQSAVPQEKGRMTRGNMNEGTRDIGNAQTPVLLFRGLDPLSGPQAIYQALLSSSGGTNGAKGIRRIILIKDKVTMASFGFAFVEFVDIQSAATVLANAMSVQLHPSGFRISDRPVAASFAHQYSFQPVTDFLQRDEACLMSTVALGGVEGTWVRYWDETSTVAVLEFKVEEPAPVAAQPKEKKEKKRVKSETDGQSKTQSQRPTLLQASDKPLAFSFGKNSSKAATGSSVLPVLGFEDTPSADSDEGPGTDPNKPIVVKKVAPLIASKKIANNINKWNQVQEELTASTSKPPTTNTQQETLADGISEFSDVVALMCLLCGRQFKSLDQLKRHNKDSDLHKKNYQDPNGKEVARGKIAARKAAASSSAAPEAPRYRDRASERRTLFNQPDAPLPEPDGSSVTGTKRKHGDDGPTPSRTPLPAPVVPVGQDESNVGNKLLKIMGWKEGNGLGTEGTGRVNPIETAVYTPGAGLGASKGKDVGKYAEGFSSYVHMAQDSARERYGA